MCCLWGCVYVYVPGCVVYLFVYICICMTACCVDVCGHGFVYVCATCVCVLVCAHIGMRIHGCRGIGKHSGLKPRAVGSITGCKQ